MKTATWSYPTQVRLGAGRIAELVKAVQAAGIGRPLVVTDPGVARLPATAAVIGLLREGGIDFGLFSEVTPNPIEKNLEDGIRAYREGGFDGVVALGGGSALDCGKLIAFQQGQTRPVFDFEDVGDQWTRADPTTIAPIVAVPTTAGTGSEVGRAAVLIEAASQRKKVIFHPKMLPAVVIADPELTVGMPPKITAGTGMDALAHCLEAYCAPAYHPMSEGIAVEGMRLVKDALPRAYANGDDLDARADMMAAAAMGAVAFQKGLGAIHSLSHPVGALYDTHHGLTNAVFMPYVLAFNRQAIEAKLERLAAWLGLENGFDGVMHWVLDLRQTLGVPHTLAGLGVDDARLDEIAAMAVDDPTASGNPVPLDVDGARRIFTAAMRG